LALANTFSLKTTLTEFKVELFGFTVIKINYRWLQPTVKDSPQKTGL
jgi:hypothetical protein